MLYTEIGLFAIPSSDQKVCCGGWWWWVVLVVVVGGGGGGDVKANFSVKLSLS